MSAEQLSKLTVPWECLQLISHPHENISTVHVVGESDETIFVFKALMEDTQYMYHELRLLLSIDSHPNIIERPYRLVLKSRPGRQAGIAGFLLKFYPGPTLQQRLQNEGPKITLDEKIAWAHHITSALIHIQRQRPRYFSYLKLNNILLIKSDEEDMFFSTPVLLDFEQRGTWYTWAPPEICYIEYIELLALRANSANVRERYRSLMEEAFPGWTRSFSKRPIRKADKGYNIAWASLNEGATAKAQVYPLGKVLWCIFEGLPSPDGPHNVESFLEDFNQNQGFPEFRLSPPKVQELIKRCTSGALEWQNRPRGVVRDGDRIAPYGMQGCQVTATETQQAASQWWLEELNRAEGFVRYEFALDGRGTTSEYIIQLKQDIASRPSLEEILETLSELQAKKS